jgi:hypothetical protein
MKGNHAGNVYHGKRCMTENVNGIPKEDSKNVLKLGKRELRNMLEPVGSTSFEFCNFSVIRVLLS